MTPLIMKSKTGETEQMMDRSQNSVCLGAGGGSGETGKKIQGNFWRENCSKSAVQHAKSHRS